MSKVQKIALIGFMGAGKSTVAELLSKHLKWQVRHLDDEIVAKSGLSSIGEIFTTYGEEHFRNLESEVTASMQELNQVIIATGGGIINRHSNMVHLQHNYGAIIYLRVAFETVRARIGDSSNRPLFADPAVALTLYNQRLSIYERYADLIIDTDGHSQSEVCGKIIREMKL